MSKLKLLLLIFIITGLNAGTRGVSDKEIKVGQSCALSGSSKKLGIDISTGMNTYFSKVNASGGINGRKITLISKDDGYEPARAKENSVALIENDSVFLLMGEVGTPTSKAVYPYTKVNNILFFAPLTGAEYLRKPFKPNVFNIRASYFQEMETLVNHLVSNQKKKKIACFYQNDSYGKAGLDGLMKACLAKGVPLVASGSYRRNSENIDNAVTKIFKKQPEVVIMIGSYKACAAFIKKAKETHPNTLFCNISFVGSEALLQELNGTGEGTIISQVVPSPNDVSITLVKEYQEDMKKYSTNGNISFVSLEGYMTAKLFCEVISNIKGDITEKSFKETLEQKETWDLGGLTLTFSDKDHQGLDEVFLTIIRDGKIESLK